MLSPSSQKRHAHLLLLKPLVLLDNTLSDRHSFRLVSATECTHEKCHLPCVYSFCFPVVVVGLLKICFTPPGDARGIKLFIGHVFLTFAVKAEHLNSQTNNPPCNLHSSCLRTGLTDQKLLNKSRKKSKGLRGCALLMVTNAMSRFKTLN